MAHKLKMPRQGNTEESCGIESWKPEEEDDAETETVICEAETGKTAFAVLAGACGTVLKLLNAAGDKTNVLKPITAIKTTIYLNFQKNPE